MPRMTFGQSGPVRCDDDLAGVFIRGDDAESFADALRLTIEWDPRPNTLRVRRLRGLANLLQAAQEPVKAQSATTLTGGSSRLYELYVTLDRAASALSADEEPIADALRDAMDPIWLALSDDEHTRLNDRTPLRRTPGVQMLQGSATPSRVAVADDDNDDAESAP